MAHAALELTLRTSGDGLAADLRFAAPGSGAVADLALGVPVSFDLPRLMALMGDWHAYGRVLTTQLFADSRMQVAWAKAQGYTERDSTPLRLSLRIDPDADALHTLRWELLQDPSSGQFLCRSERVLFARYLETRNLAPITTPDRSALRALVLVANPNDLEAYNLAPVDVDGELVRARAALGDLTTTVLARPPHGQGATLDALLTALRAGHPLLSLVCHGSMVQGKPILWLEQADGRSHRLPGATLVQRIADLDPARRPLLIILSACQTAGRDQHADVLAALGPQLARAGVGAVIGMQGNVPMALIEILLPRLLRELREAGQIDRALALARAALPEDQPWWMPVLFMRVRDGRLWHDDTPAPPAVAAAPPVGLANLARQLRDPRVREELTAFQTTFRAARDQIALLNRYKGYHDMLQELERPFNVLARERRRLINDPSAWDDLLDHLIGLHDCTQATLALISDSQLSTESAWGLQQLELAAADLELAQNQADPRRLDLAISRYKRVLARELPRADSRLAACAGDLHLTLVIQALSHVQQSLQTERSDLAALRELATWTTTLDHLNTRLTTLVPNHQRWQDVDSELRRVAECLGGDPSDLELAWSDLELLTTPLFGALEAAWATALNTLSVQISDALSAGAVPQARRLFISYQSRATRHFVEIDKTLLATCNELRGAGDALDLILRTLDEGDR